MDMKEKDVFGILIIGILISLMISKIGINNFGADAYFHALAGFFLYDIAKWWLFAPTISIDSVMGFIINYQAQFKFFGGFGYYPPLQSFIIAFLCFFGGKSMTMVYLASALETVIAIVFTAKIYELIYDKKIKMIYLLVFFMALNPVIFLYGASSSLDPGLMLFSVLTIYYLILFLKKGNNSHLYLTALMLGLGILMKRPMILILPVIILSFFFERKVTLLKNRFKPILFSILIFLLTISPLLIMELIFIISGVSKIDERVVLLSTVVDLNRINFFISMSFFTLFGNILLVLFFVLKLINITRKRSVGEISMLFYVLILFVFYNFFSHVEERYLLPVIPFVILLSVNGIQHALQKTKSKILYFILFFMLFTTPLICYGYNIEQINKNTSTDYTRSALYVSENSNNKTSVISQFSREHALAFNLLDEKNIFTIHTPFENNESLNELKFMLHSKEGCLPRPSKPEWERFGICHPPIGWVLVEEEWDNVYVPYSLKEVVEKRDDFCHVETIEGKIPNKRIFIYQRC